MHIRYSERARRTMRDADEGGGGQGGTPTSGDPGNTGGQPNGETGGGQGGEGGGDDGVEKWKGHARTWETRAGEHKTRADTAEAELTKAKEREAAIRKAAGIDPEEEDPAEAAKRTATERDQAAKERDEHAQTLKVERLERRAEKAARTAGLDPDALLDSRGFAGVLSKLDPEADDFADQLKAAVEKAAEDNPRLKVDQPSTTPAPATTPPAGGGEDGTSGSSTSAVEAALKARREARKPA